MRVRGALHVHSTFSHDGSLTVAELAQFYAKRGFHFVAIGEHSQDMNVEKVNALVEQCATVSNPGFLLVPGIEYTCNVPGMHILGVGGLGLAPNTEPMSAVQTIHEGGGFAVLAHPKRFGWRCPVELTNQIDAVEIWNVGYDGKFLPARHANAAFRVMKATNPKLLGVASHDLHREPQFYDVGIDMEVAALTCDAVIASLRAGTYRISSQFFSSDPHFQISWMQAAFLRVFSSQLYCLRQARALALRWSA